MNEQAIGEFVPYMLSFISASAVAWISSHIAHKHTLREMRESKYNEHKVCLYERLCNLLIDLKQDPSLSLDEGYVSRVMACGASVRIFASKDAQDMFGNFANDLSSNLAACKNRLEQFDGKYWTCEEQLSLSGQVNYVKDYIGKYDPTEYERLREDLRRSFEFEQSKVHEVMISLTQVIRRDLT